MLNSLTPTDIAILLISLVAALVIHEFMHAYAGHLLGDTTAEQEGRLSLNPLRHIDPFMTVVLPAITILLFGLPVLAAKPVPFNPDRVKYDEFGAAMIAAAGPLTNLVLAFLAALILRGLSPGGFAWHALDIFATLNVAIFVFNILPIPPLDGSRVLYAFAPEPLQDFMRQIESFGLFIVLGLALTFHSLLQNLIQFVLNLLP